jgi:hypothetical protein
MMVTLMSTISVVVAAMIKAPVLTFRPNAIPPSHHLQIVINLIVT